ncbi:hypothetical protein PoB_005306900 [Plakobranchus ocellatus]|uniref:Uncharacterized protein n=1 Tax=Plakobranchus ocellatus TaxID=259542 RepID=A0AAV4C7A6_9GAST|nr:hypothetical protein PoB_005306900 [Plakobranchus ocellatus]
MHLFYSYYFAADDLWTLLSRHPPALINDLFESRDIFPLEFPGFVLYPLEEIQKRGLVTREPFSTDDNRPGDFKKDSLLSWEILMKRTLKLL